jgi:hypothetical protein
MNQIPKISSSGEFGGLEALEVLLTFNELDESEVLEVKMFFLFTIKAKASTLTKQIVNEIKTLFFMILVILYLT